MKRHIALLLLEKLPVLDFSWPAEMQAQWWAWLHDLINALMIEEDYSI